MDAVYSSNADAVRAGEAASAQKLGRVAYRNLDAFLADESAPLVEGAETVHVYATGKGADDVVKAVAGRYGDAAEVKRLTKPSAKKSTKKAPSAAEKAAE